ncbi:right-handed parallel beta-helix repeat-containing protein [Myxococcus qinghaiensis]|uniref:right-handed parallel beta-helix repeat-containing protein n=1 Tax=Myxococcus qinghaiensis TaxID=2906758 RepID=UPI00225DD8E3|nr:right-handed parallel beta-helix repeat-containing protein [Myxococcus qinghaiensis]
MNRANALRLALLASALVTAMGCHQEDPPGAQVEPAGSVRVVAVLPRSLPLDAVARVDVSATPARATAVTASLASSETLSWQGLLRGLLSGEGTTVGARVVDSAGAVLAQVEVPAVELPRHHAALVVLVPRETDSEATRTAPLIDAVVASRASVSPGTALKLRALARSADASESLTYAWRASSGSFADATAVDAEWTAPLRRGAVNLTLEVTNARGAVSTLRFSVDVELAGGGDLEHTASLNHAPVLTELGANPVSQSRVGVPVALQAVGVDDDGDALTFAWSSTCEGTFERTDVAVTRFTPRVAPAAACDNCRLTLRVSDGFGAQRERSLDLCVTNPLPPSITEVSQSEEDATAGRPVRLSATANDPQGEPLTFVWTTNAGLLGNAARAGDSGSADWVALSCLPADAAPVITLTVTNASGLSATREFAVAWGDSLCGEYPPCAATLNDSAVVTLTADCTTEQTVWIPDGYTLDGAGHVLTAVDARERGFRGAVLSSLGTTAHVRAVTVAARGLSERVCDGGSARLRGILFEGASGSIVDSAVLDVNQKAGEGGCQEGVGIEVRNALSAESVAKVEVLRNRVERYQKAGIVGTGKVELSLEDNRVDGGGPVPFIARNGIQLSDGATGRVVGNTVKGNAYTGDTATGSGILIAGGPYYGMALCQDVVIFENTLEDNDVGINLSQGVANGGPLPAPTRLQVTRNRVTHAGPVTNGYPYQAGISDLGGANLISQNRVDGPGYARDTQPGATFDVDVVAGAAARLDFVTPEREARVGQCSEAVVVQSQDALGNLSALTAPALVVEATGTAALAVGLYADSACTEALAPSGAGWALTLTGAQQEATLYFHAAQAGALTLIATGTGASGTQAHTVR